MAGLTVTGFERRRLPDLKARLEDAIRAAFGPQTDVSPQSVFGQLIGVTAQGEAELWELAEAVYLSMYPASAEGISLDDAVSLLAMRRLGPLASTAFISATGTEGTIIPAASLVANSAGEQFETLAAGTITSTAADRASIEVLSAVIGQSYTVTINGSPVAVIATSSVLSQVAEQISDAIGTAQLGVDASADVVVVSVFAQSEAFSVTVGAALSIIERAARIKVAALAVGPADVSAGSINSIVTPVAGWASVTNREPGVIGRLIESDAELRVRRRAGVRGAGAGSPHAITARLLQEVANLRTAKLYENRTNAVDADGRPAHSFEVIAEGGDDQDVADAIWRLKPAGIETVGSTTIGVIDSAGVAQSVQFSRPGPVYVWVRVSINALYGEEEYPVDGAAQVQAAVAAEGNLLAVGANVIPQRLLSAVYSVPGIEDVTIELSTSAFAAGPPGAFQATPLSIGPAARARFAPERVEVILA